MASAYHVVMANLSDAVRMFIEGGPLAHVVTLNRQGDPDVSMAWVGLDGDEVVIGTLGDQRKLRNLRADPRIALSFAAPGRNAWGLDKYLVLRGHARVTEGGAPELLQRLAHVYLGPDVVFPAMPNPPPGYTIRIAVEKVSGLGDWDLPYRAIVLVSRSSESTADRRGWRRRRASGGCRPAGAGRCRRTCSVRSGPRSGRCRRPATHPR